MYVSLLASRPHLEINEYKTENDILLDLRLCFRLFVLHLFACMMHNSKTQLYLANFGLD